MNLAINARDAMPKGGKLEIRTSVAHLDEREAGALHLRSGKYVVLLVEDDGEGMTDEVKAHIFEPFFTTKRPGKGTGLGLATVYAIVHQSGGDIDVASKVGGGTAFRIYFPVVQQDAVAKPIKLLNSSSADTKPSWSLRTKKICAS